MSSDPWSNAEFAIGFSRPFLNFLGVWPHKSNYSRIRRRFSDLRFCLVLLLCLNIILIPQTTKLYFAEGDLDLIIDILSTAVLPVLVAFMKIVVVQYNTEALSDLLDRIYADWRDSAKSRPAAEIARMRSNASTGRRIAVLCIGVAYATSAIFFVLRLIVMSRKQEQQPSLLLESHFPRALMHSPWFETLWLVQGATTFVATTAYASIDGFFAVFVLHVCGQFQMLREDFCRLDVGGDGSSSDACRLRSRMREIVARHNQLNKFTGTIESTFNRLFLLQITACIFQFCLQGYLLISIITNVSLELPYLQVTFMILFIAYMTGDLYIYCYVAEKLNDRNSDLLVAVYECQWWALERRDALTVLLIMERAQRPPQLTAGKFCVLSFRLFAIIGKTSLGYLSMLLAVKER